MYICHSALTEMFNLCPWMQRLTEFDVSVTSTFVLRACEDGWVGGWFVSDHLLHGMYVCLIYLTN